MPTFSDQLNRPVSLSVWPPRRIVSLVPSQTELLSDLGLGEKVVGITKFCVRPREWFQTKPRVGGTKTVHFEKIAALQPDLILGNKEENERAQIEALAEKYPVWLSDVRALDTALDMMTRVGALTDTADEAEKLVREIQTAFYLHGFIRQSAQRDGGPSSTVLPVKARSATAGHRLKTAYFIWRKPYMVAGGDTFIDAMLTEAGFVNVFAGRERYPEISLEALSEARPEVILLSSEPYPFAEKHFDVFREACPGAQIRLADGEFFSWYGSRLRGAPAYFAALRNAVLDKK